VDALYAVNPGSIVFDQTCTCSNGGTLAAGGVPAVCGWPLGAQTNVGWYCTVGAANASCMTPGAVLHAPPVPAAGSSDITKALVDAGVVPPEMLPGTTLALGWESCAGGAWTIPAIEPPWGTANGMNSYICMNYGASFSGAFCLVNANLFNINFIGPMSKTVCVKAISEHIADWVRLGLFQIRSNQTVNTCTGWYGLTPQNYQTYAMQSCVGADIPPPGFNPISISRLCDNVVGNGVTPGTSNWGTSWALPPPQ